MNTIQEIYNEFIECYNKTNALLSDSTIFYQNRVVYQGRIYSQAMYSAIVEYCFMQLFLAWENFLEQSFVAYLCGEPDLKGEAYVKYASPIENQHAYDMIKGTKQYPDWTNIKDINTLSNIYFDNAGPFVSLTCNPLESQQIKTIRNRISHVSEKSTRDFNRLLTQTITRSTNVSVCDFLVTFTRNSITYYTYYTDVLKSYVDTICNK